MDNLVLYNGAGITTYAKQLMAKEVVNKINEIGLEVYDPSSQPFNDKKAVGGSDIGRLIVAKDTEAIYNSDVRLMNTQEDNLGTCIEAGIIKGYRDQAEVVLQTIVTMIRDGKDSDSILMHLLDHTSHELQKPYIPYHTDIRIHDEPESGFRRSVGFHQFLRGVNLLLVQEEPVFDGFFSLNDAYEQLDKLKESHAKRKAPTTVNISPVGEISVLVNLEQERTTEKRN